MIKKRKNLVNFAKSHFFDRKSSIWSILVKTYRSSYFVKYSKLNKEHYCDAHNIIKRLFSGVMGISDQNMILNDGVHGLKRTDSCNS
jgi:hypothetical protein